MRLRTLGKALGFTAAGLVAIVLLALLALRLAIHRIPAYQSDIKEWVHRQTGYHVAFQSVSPSFRWHGPEVYFKGLELRSKDNARVLAHAAGGRIAVDVRTLLHTGQLLAGRIELDGADIVITRLGPERFALGGEIQIGGAGTADGSVSDATGTHLADLPAGRVVIRGASVTLRNWNDALPELVAREVAIDLHRDPAGAGIAVSGRLPPLLGGRIDARLGVSGDGGMDSWRWTALAQIHDVSFPGWRLALPDYLGGLEAGTGQFDLSAAGHGASVMNAGLKMTALGVATQLADGPIAKFDQISGALNLVHNGERWNLSGQHVRTSPHDPESTFDVSWGAAATGALDVRAQADYLRADTLLPLAEFLPQKAIRTRLLEIAPTGEWRNTHVGVWRAGTGMPLKLDIRATFHDAGFAPVGRAPGLRGLSGSIVGDQSGGHIYLDSSAATFSWPAQFMQPVTAEKLSAKLYWKRTPEELLVAGNDWQIVTRDASMHGKVAWQLPADGTSPLLTLVSSIENGDVMNAKNYFPRALLPPPALQWLDRAFVTGRLTRADALFRGPIRQFPFRDGSGLFLVRCAVENMTLDYSEGWPVAQDVKATAEFRNEGVSMRFQSGRIRNVPVQSGEAQFPDFKTGELKLRIVGSGDAGAAVDYLRATPLDALADHLFSGLEAAGPMQATINLFLPFKDFANRRVLVHAHVDGASLNQTGSTNKATGLQGDFDIDGAHVALADLHGELLGGPFEMQARSGRARPLLRTQLEFRGTARAEALHDALGLPPGVDIGGQTDWRGVLKIANEPTRERSLRITTPLVGVQMRLPAPLDKPAEVPLPAWLEIQWPMNGGQLGRFELGSVASGSYALSAGKSGPELARATVNLGGEEAAATESQIFNIGGSVERLDLAGWLRLNTPDKDGKPLSYWLRSARLHVAELDYLGLAFRDLSLKLTANDADTRIEVGGPNVRGSIWMPLGARAAEPWKLQFEQVKFDVADADAPVGDDGSARATGAAKAGTVADGISPRNVPALNFHAAQLIWGGRHFGDVEASVGRLDDGVSLQRLAVTGPSLSVAAQGEWRGAGSGASRIQGTMNSTDVEATMKALGYADVLQAHSGKIDFDLGWDGAPTSQALNQVGGEVQLALDKGQLTGINPGAGRVLGLTSLAALPRRLSLDFSDLTDKGLAFDTVRGSFNLRSGNAYTDDVLLEGPAAEIGLIGRIGLKNRDYDQTAVVTGTVSNTLPLAAFAGGPVVGAAVLLFTQVFKEPLRGLARGYYRITGSWDNPTVERIRSADAATATAEGPR
jgi:uncharacterized protein (TIGR02099 family)